MDLYSAYNYIIAAHRKRLCSTELQLEIPEGCYGRIAPRSGLATDYFLAIGVRVIDPDFRGPVRVLIFNHADTAYTIRAGDRIAQLLLEKCVFVNEI